MQISGLCQGSIALPDCVLVMRFLEKRNPAFEGEALAIATSNPADADAVIDLLEQRPRNFSAKRAFNDEPPGATKQIDR